MKYGFSAYLAADRARAGDMRSSTMPTGRDGERVRLFTRRGFEHLVGFADRDLASMRHLGRLKIHTVARRFRITDAGRPQSCA